MLKKNLPMLVGFGLPLLVILVIAGLAYIPAQFIHPGYNILYVADSYYATGVSYAVDKNGKLVQEVNEDFRKYYDSRNVQGPVSQLLVYDAKTGNSREISFEDAQKFEIISDATSPDGYVIEQNHPSRDSFSFLFGGGGDTLGFYIKGSFGGRKIDFPQKYQYANPQFLGWIK